MMEQQESLNNSITISKSKNLETNENLDDDSKLQANPPADVDKLRSPGSSNVKLS